MKKTYKQIKLYQKRLKEPLNKTDFKNFNMYYTPILANKVMMLN
jgi:hypothetical protein